MIKSENPLDQYWDHLGSEEVNHVLVKGIDTGLPRVSLAETVVMIL